jgi:glycosyltransferase involved in cell wall biosynthesis
VGTSPAHPTFSVLIAAYESATFIGDGVHSALDQEPPPLEVIVGDDGSTDDLAGALAPFGTAVRVVRIDHAGEAAAKNAAAAAATGDFLAFLDADDRFLPGRLAAIGQLAAEQPEVDVITTDAYLVHDGRVLGRCYGPGHAFAPADQRSAILRTNFVLGLSAVRRSRFVEVGGFDESVLYTTDWELWIRLIFSGSRVGIVPEPLAEYRLHQASMSARRGAMSRGRLETLARAAARPDLADAERAILAETRRREHARLARELLKEELSHGRRSSAQRRALRLLVSADQSFATRLKALASLLAPGAVSRRLQAEDARSFVTVGDRRLQR